MNFVNGWKSNTKNWDKFNLTLRVSKITLFGFQFDISNKTWSLYILNYGIKNK